MQYLVLVSLILGGCQNTAVDKKLNDIMVQNEDLRRRVMDLDNDLFDLTKRMESSGAIKKESK